jgi:spermidine synthase
MDRDAERWAARTDEAADMTLLPVAMDIAPLETPAAGAEAGSKARRKHARLQTPGISLLVLVFVSGMTSLGLEVTASRLLAPFFGTSLLVWANLIGLVLIYLSVGYFLGGRLADRFPNPRVLCALTAVAAIAVGIIPFASHPVLLWSVSGLDTANVGVFYGSLLAVVLLFSIPVTLLGVVSPFAVRLSVERVGSAGRSAGSLYALSTAGSIVGTFLPVLVLIPAWGVRRTLLAASVTLLAASLWGLRLPARLAVSVPGLILLVPLLLPQVAPLGLLKPQPGLVFEQESLYNYVQVVQDADGTRKLILNEGHAIHSIYNPSTVLTGPGWYTDYVLAAPYFTAGPAAGQVRRVANIGLAGGTVARVFTAVYGPVPIDGVEIDPLIVSVGRRYFGMTEPNLHVFVEDGRAFMRATHATYDVVVVDAYQQPYMPFHLATKEFLEEIRAHLSPSGVVCFTTGHSRTDYQLVQAFVNTLSQVFPSVYTIDVPTTYNTEVIATMSPTSVAMLSANLDQVPSGSLMATVASEILPIIQVAHAQPGGIVFTDDQAPIEQITDQLILNYIQDSH